MPTPPTMPTERQIFFMRRADDNDLIFARELIRNNMMSYYKMIGLDWNNDAFQEIWNLTSNIIVTPPEKDASPIGVMRMHISDQEATLWDLQLLSEYRNQGMGKQLLQHCIQISRNAGCKLITLNVCKANPALSLYQRAGFQIDNETEHQIKMKFLLS
jgi:ribosomal protein S18 acetylase RimI-like enzyme